MRPVRATLTEQELEIMKVVWQLETATVRNVYETLLERRRIAYTTVMTMMNILEQKGHLKKRFVDRAYIYRPRQPKNQVIGQMVREFVNRVFNGSAEPLLAHLIEDRHLTESDLDEIRRMISSAQAAAVVRASTSSAQAAAVVRASTSSAQAAAVVRASTSNAQAPAVVRASSKSARRHSGSPGETRKPK